MEPLNSYNLCVRTDRIIQHSAKNYSSPSHVHTGAFIPPQLQLFIIVIQSRTRLGLVGSQPCSAKGKGGWHPTPQSGGGAIKGGKP